MNYFNRELIEKFPFEQFQQRKPFPWIDFEKFLTPEAFQTLHHDFPSLALFEYHENIYRKGQRPHNRYYLAYEVSVYNQPDGKPTAGVVRKNDLSESWQGFLEELEHGTLYRPFIQKALGSQNFFIRYAWHIGKSSNEVSPHMDASSKLGTHIFYFNTSADWQAEWGGQLVVLEGKKVPGMAPDFHDFAKETAVSNMDNHSFFFKNSNDAWHGVKALECPEGKYRKLFNVIFEAQ